MVRILFITHQKPFPDWDGHTLRTYNICKNLKKRNNQIFLYYLENPKISIEESDKLSFFDLLRPISDFIKVKAISYNKLLILGFLSSFFNVGLYNFFLSQNKLKKIIEEHSIDVIHTIGHFPALMVTGFDEKPKIIDLTDSLTLYFKRQIVLEKSFIRKMKLIFFGYLWKRIERSILLNSDLITSVSPLDSAMMEKISNKEIFTVQNGIDTKYFSPQRNIKEHYPSILFHGNIGFQPNIDAINYIIEEIFPNIKKSFPETLFYIVGRNPSETIMNLNNSKDIIVTGEVIDIREFISKATIVIVPMQSGSGIKNKILEAMAMEKPVITNEIGVEAFDDQIKDKLLIGKNSTEIVELALDLLNDSQKIQNLGKEGRKYVEENYSWKNVSNKYEELYELSIKKEYE